MEGRPTPPPQPYKSEPTLLLFSSLTNLQAPISHASPKERSMSQLSPCTAAKTSAKRSPTYPKKEYNPLLKLTFNSNEDEDLWYFMSQSIYLVKPIISTLSPHKPTLTSMEIRSHLYGLFECVELDIDRTMRRPAHKDLVYEFLASFNCIHNGEPYGRDSAWQFRIQNTNFVWTRGHTKTFLDFPLTGAHTIPTVAQSSSFWTRITGLNSFGAKESPFAIKSSVWQVAHRLIATNINCQPDSNDCVTLEDLELMWAVDIGEAIDWFKIFSLRFLSMKELHGPRRFVGCTSLITRIAECCGFEFSCHPYESRVLDAACWKKLCIIARPLPDPAGLTDVSEELSVNQGNNDQSKDAEEPARSDSKGRKKRIEIETGVELNDKVDWTKVRKVVVYEF